ALARPAEHDAAVGLAPGDPSAHLGADGRVVDRVRRVGAEVGDLVAEPGQLLDQVSLEVHAGVIGSDGDSHPVLFLSCGPTPTEAGHAIATTRPSRCSSSTAVAS